VAAQLRLDLAQYRELVTFTQFGAEIEKTTQAQLNRGERMVEVLKQVQYLPLPLAKQVMILYAGTSGSLEELAVPSIRRFESEFFAYMDKNQPEIEKEIQARKVLDEPLTKRLDEAIRAFKNEFKAVP
jgi:F-type H+-transporting ATPase subunit alpha